MAAILKQSTVSKFSETLIPPKINRPLVYGFAYIPEVKPPFFNIGYYAQANNDDPSGTVIVLTAENDDPKNPLLKHPVDYTNIGVINYWTPFDSGVPTYYLAVWAPVAPQGYVPLGMAATMASEIKSFKPPPLDAVMCLRADKATQVKDEQLKELWGFQPIDQPISANYVYQVPWTNVMAAATSGYPTVYVPTACIPKPG